jgi:hypothetical protein
MWGRHGAVSPPPRRSRMRSAKEADVSLIANCAKAAFAACPARVVAACPTGAVARRRARYAAAVARRVTSAVAAGVAGGTAGAGALRVAGALLAEHRPLCLLRRRGREAVDPQVVKFQSELFFMVCVQCQNERWGCRVLRDIPCSSCSTEPAILVVRAERGVSGFRVAAAVAARIITATVAVA